MSGGFTQEQLDELKGYGLLAPSADLAAMAGEARIAAAEAKAAEAWEASSPRKGVEAAQAALAESVYCPAALTLLSLFVARDLPERVRLLKLAFAAGTAALGARIESEAGKLGESPRGLAYLEARQHYASALSVMGDRAGAFGHWREVLRLDPSDPSRARLDFADALIDAGENAEADALLARFADADARAAYAKALLAFRANGAGAQADAALDAALTANGFVPAYLVGDRKPPKTAPLSVDPGSREEAIVVGVNAAAAWAATPGAVAWLKERRRRTTM